MMMAPMMPIVSPMMPVSPPVGNAKHALHATDRSADARTDCAAHHTTDRAGSTVSMIDAFPRAADNALRMRGKRDRQHREECKGPEQAPLLRGVYG